MRYLTLIILLIIITTSSCSKSSHDQTISEINAPVVTKTEIENTLADSFLGLYQFSYQLAWEETQITSETSPEKIAELKQKFTKLIEFANSLVNIVYERWAEPSIEISIKQETCHYLKEEYQYPQLWVTNLDAVPREILHNQTLHKLIFLAQKQGSKNLLFDPLMSMTGRMGFYNSNAELFAFSANTLFWLFRGDDITKTIRHELTHGFFEAKRQQGIDSIYHPMFISFDTFYETQSSGSSGYEKYMTAEELYTFSNGPYWINKFDPVKYDATAWTMYFHEMKSVIEGTVHVAGLVHKHTTNMMTWLDQLAEEYMSYFMWDSAYKLSTDLSQDLYLLDYTSSFLMQYYLPPSNDFVEKIIQFTNHYGLNSFEDSQQFMNELSEFWELENPSPEQQEMIDSYTDILQAQYSFYFDVYTKMAQLQTVATYYLENSQELLTALEQFGQDAEPYWELIRNNNYTHPEYQQRFDLMLEILNQFKKLCRRYAMFAREETEEFKSLFPEDQQQNAAPNAPQL